MDEGILISVIIPAYNAEKYLDRAVQSVLCQMDGSIELILVNDGSTDGTGVLCDGYVANNSNVRVIHKENGGSSKARNAGINASRGEYLMFLDADDYFEPDAFREVTKVILTHHPDMIDFGWRYVSNGVAMAPAFHKLPKNTLLREKELEELILPPLLNLRNDPEHFVFDFVWNKVFLAEIVHNNTIRFGETRRTWEDRPFVLRFLKCCRNYYAIGQCLHNYVDVPGSKSRKYSIERLTIILENYLDFRQLFGDQYDFDTAYSNSYWCRAIENMIFRSLEQTDNRELIRKTIMNVLQNEQVVHWYKNRIPKNSLERKVSELVVGGQYEEALKSYEKAVKRDQSKQDMKKVFLNIKTILRRVIRR